MEAFGIIGMTFGLMGLTFAIQSSSRIDKLEKQLKAQGVLEKDFYTEKSVKIEFPKPKK